jgi:hypothetical protein
VKYTALKKFSGILLLVCLTIPYLGTYSWFEFQKYMVKKEIKWQILRGMDLKDLALIKVNKSEVETKIRWIHSREFEYSGHMYDIVKREARGDTIYLYCFPDRAETKLNIQLTRLMAQAMSQHPQNTDHQKQLTDFFKTFFCNPLHGKSQNAFIIEGNPFQVVDQHAFSLYSLPTPSPPPKNC